ncbi:MAG: protease inhibitor I42 family protein [Chloroflexi bacterium]|nr:protease inhibitor I42 family protein [Chloroflexota bacterium]
MKKLFLPLVLTALFLTACSGTSTRPSPTAHPPRPTPSAAELQITDPSTPIEVTAGSEFTITVRTNPSPDYHWEVAEALDAHIVEYVWKDHVPDNPSDPNSSGKDVWRFKAVAPGTTTITLGYYEGMTDNAAQKPVFTVVVK